MTQPEDVGSLAEEAVKLAEELLGDAEYRDHRSACTWCPLCQFVNAVRGNPEVVEQFASVLVMLIRAGRAFLESAAPSTEDPR